MDSIRKACRYLKRAMRTANSLARDTRIPKWLRVVLVIACLPIPGPVDNAVQVLVFLVLLVFYRAILAEAWAVTGAEAQS